jgi:hypothetical protein
VDDTLARKHGKCVALASMHHDPLLWTGRKPFFSVGHVWVVLAVWAGSPRAGRRSALPMGRERGFALPILFRLYRGKERGGQAGAPSRRGKPPSKRRQAALLAGARERRSKPELARDLVDLAAGWAGERTVYVAADSLYAGRPPLEGHPANVHVISRLRPDASLWTPPPPRRPGQRGRLRRRGERHGRPRILRVAPESGEGEAARAAKTASRRWAPSLSGRRSEAGPYRVAPTAHHEASPWSAVEQ